MSIYLLAKKAKRHQSEKVRNSKSPFYLNMTHTGRLITKCNSNPPTPAPQKCYGQFMKQRISKYVNNRTDVIHKRMPDFWSSQHTANLTSKTIMDQNCCDQNVQPRCYNNCDGSRNNKSTVTKDIGLNKSSSWKIAKVKAARVCICEKTNGKYNKYETKIFGNKPYACRG